MLQKKFLWHRRACGRIPCNDKGLQTTSRKQGSSTEHIYPYCLSNGATGLLSASTEILYCYVPQSVVFVPVFLQANTVHVHLKKQLLAFHSDCWKFHSQLLYLSSLTSPLLVNRCRGSHDFSHWEVIVVLMFISLTIGNVEPPVTSFMKKYLF